MKIEKSFLKKTEGGEEMVGKVQKVLKNRGGKIRGKRGKNKVKNINEFPLFKSRFFTIKRKKEVLSFIMYLEKKHKKTLLRKGFSEIETEQILHYAMKYTLRRVEKAFEKGEALTISEQYFASNIKAGINIVKRHEKRMVDTDIIQESCDSYDSQVAIETIETLIGLGNGLGQKLKKALSLIKKGDEKAFSQYIEINFSEKEREIIKEVYEKISGEYEIERETNQKVVDLQEIYELERFSVIGNKSF